MGTVISSASGAREKHDYLASTRFNSGQNFDSELPLGQTSTRPNIKLSQAGTSEQTLAQTKHGIFIGKLVEKNFEEEQKQDNIGDKNNALKVVAFLGKPKLNLWWTF